MEQDKCKICDHEFNEFFCNKCKLPIYDYIKQLQADNKLLREALEKYADKYHWRDVAMDYRKNMNGSEDKYREMAEFYDEHGYELAQETLAKIGGKDGASEV